MSAQYFENENLQDKQVWVGLFDQIAARVGASGVCLFRLDRTDILKCRKYNQAVPHDTKEIVLQILQHHQKTLAEEFERSTLVWLNQLVARDRKLQDFIDASSVFPEEDGSLVFMSVELEELPLVVGIFMTDIDRPDAQASLLSARQEIATIVEAEVLTQKTAARRDFDEKARHFDDLKVGIVGVNAGGTNSVMNSFAEKIIIDEGLGVEDLPDFLTSSSKTPPTSTGHSFDNPKPGVTSVYRTGDLSWLVRPGGVYDDLTSPFQHILVLMKSTSRQKAVEAFGEQNGLLKSEVRAVGALCDGLSVAEISATYGIAESTVRQQLKSVFQKSGLRSQTGIVAAVLRTVCG
ncbi:hypothetical protein K3727_01740 [Rhodobacteraceae bacterium M382]|nr:hypothetical protein K3727_01740 [Rhodobacteraceae bacterium M382]